MLTQMSADRRAFWRERIGAAPDVPPGSRLEPTRTASWGGRRPAVVRWIGNDEWPSHCSPPARGTPCRGGRSPARADGRLRHPRPQRYPSVITNDRHARSSCVRSRGGRGARERCLPAAPWTGQKTGAFLDQRENRARAGELARGRALDCFSYHGSFALHLATGADEVTAVDSSADALERARENATRNGVAIANDEGVESRGTRAACGSWRRTFDFLRAQEAAGAVRYDRADPPAFAKRKDAVDALRGYKEINLRAMRSLPVGTCSRSPAAPRASRVPRDAR